MGKAKKRGFNLRQKNQYTNITRSEAVEEIIRLIDAGEDTTYLVSLFGITQEELLEAGGDYETVMEKFK